MDQKLLKILGGSTENYPYILESKYPRVFATLMLMWDTPQGETYLNSLMVNERIDREGFPPDVAAEILRLGLVHASLHHKNLNQDVWEPEARMFTSFDPQVAHKNALAWPTIPDETARIIVSLGVPCTLDGFFRAASSGNLPAVRLFLEAGVHLEVRNEEDWTALMAAAFNDQEQVLNALLQKGAQVNASETGGNTALHWAAFGGRLNCCKLLMVSGADINARSNFGWTPLYQSVARNHIVVAAYLISHGGDINASARDGQTPLHKAAASGSGHMIKLLLSHNADPHLTNQLGETPLALAIKNHQDEAEAILRASA